MEKYTQTILRVIEDQLGYDASSTFANKLAKRLSNSNLIQHHTNALVREIKQCIDKQPSLIPRSRQQASKGSINIDKSNRRLDQNKMSGLLTSASFRVPNIQVGKYFNETIIPLDKLKGDLFFAASKGLETIGEVEIDEKSFCLKGTATVAGDHEIKIFCILLQPNGQTQRVIGKLKLTIIPDPRLLWKDLASDASARFHKPDTKSLSQATDTVVLLAGSVRGRSHAHKGLHRDDDVNIACASATDWNILCVADGAGSCKLSRRGAELVTLRSTKTLRETLNGHYGQKLEQLYQDYVITPNDETKRQLQEGYQHTIIKAVFDGTRAILDEVKHGENDTFKDYSTTLLLAAHKAISDGHLIMSFWVGDGAAVIYRQNKEVFLLGDPDSGEYAGQTRFLGTSMFDDGSVYNRVVMKKVTDMTALILVTDGISDAKFETEKQLSSISIWDNLWSELAPFVSNSDLKRSEDSLLEWMNFWSAGNHDDRSIAICFNKG